jgi:hypothetical protein
MAESLDRGARAAETEGQKTVKSFEVGELSNAANRSRRADIRNSSIRAELLGSYGATAAGITVDYARRRRGSPVCELARRLIMAGQDPASMLLAYRGRTLCFEPRPLFVWAGLRVKESDGARASARFDRYAPPRAPRRGSTGHLPVPENEPTRAVDGTLRPDGGTRTSGSGDRPWSAHEWQDLPTDFASQFAHRTRGRMGTTTPP